MAFEIASAVHTPLPPPDMSSPRSSLANLSFIISISGRPKKKSTENPSNQHPKKIRCKKQQISGQVANAKSLQKLRKKNINYANSRIRRETRKRKERKKS